MLPGLSDKPELLADVVKAARDHGATHVWANVLYLRPGTREHFLDKLGEIWPELIPMYERLYANGRAYLPEGETRPRRAAVQSLARKYYIADRRRLAPGEPGANELARERVLRVVPDAQQPAQQLELILSDDAHATASKTAA